MPAVEIPCANCGYAMKVPERALGKTFTCPKCASKIDTAPGGAVPVAPSPVPSPAAAAEPEPAPPAEKKRSWFKKGKSAPKADPVQGPQGPRRKHKRLVAERRPAGYEDNDAALDGLPEVEPFEPDSAADSWDAPEPAWDRPEETSAPAGDADEDLFANLGYGEGEPAWEPAPPEPIVEPDEAVFMPPSDIETAAPPMQFIAPVDDEPEEEAPATLVEDDVPLAPEPEPEPGPEAQAAPVLEPEATSAEEKMAQLLEPPKDPNDASEESRKRRLGELLVEQGHITQEQLDRTLALQKERGGGEPPKRRLGELLVDNGHIAQEHLERALTLQKERGGKIAEILIEEGYLDVKTFMNFLSKQPGVASIDLLNYEIPQELLSLVPREIVMRHEVLPIDKLGRHLTVGMACPLDSRTIGELEELTGLKVRPLLCSVSDMRAAIERYYPPEDKKQGQKKPAGLDLGSLMPSSAPAAKKAEVPAAEVVWDRDRATSTVQRLETLPTLPGVVERVRNAMEDPATAAAAVAQAVTQDPPVAAKLLSLANSEDYKLPHPVADVGMAANLLGLRETLKLVTEFETFDPAALDAYFDSSGFWRRAQFCALAAAALGKTRRLTSKEGAKAAGLLHEFGALALAHIAPEKYAEIDRALHGKALAAAQKEVFGLAYPEVGYILARAWNLPPQIAFGLRFQLEPRQATEYPTVAAVVALAAAMAQGYREDGNHEESFTEGRLIDAAGLDTAVALDVFNETIKAVEAGAVAS